jgi:hypothetical protein
MRLSPIATKHGLMRFFFTLSRKQVCGFFWVAANFNFVFFPIFHNYLKIFYHRVWHLMLFFSPFITTVYNFFKELR